MFDRLWYFWYSIFILVSTYSTNSPFFFYVSYSSSSCTMLCCCLPPPVVWRASSINSRRNRRVSTYLKIRIRSPQHPTNSQIFCWVNSPKTNFTLYRHPSPAIHLVVIPRNATQLDSYVFVPSVVFVWSKKYSGEKSFLDVLQKIFPKKIKTLKL